MKLSRRKSFGVSSLVMIVSLMLISTLFILFATQFSILQQRITANLYRNQQAFQAARAGLEAAIPYFESHYNPIVSQQSGGYLTPYITDNTHNVALADGSNYSFVFTNPVANNYQLITITSTGVNADGTSTRVLTQQIQSYGSGMILPTVSLGAQGSVSLGNTASINNVQTNANIDAGSGVSFGSTAHTTTSSGITSSSSGLGSDVTQNDNSISSYTSANYFKKVFGVSESSMQSIANYTFTNLSNYTYNSNLNGLTGAIIWINQLSGTATINSTTVIGSVAQPVILIISGGSLLISGSAVINGFIFVLNPSNTVTINQNAIINGAASTTGSLSFQDSSALNYNSAILNALPSVGATYSYAKVPGSWRDF